MNLPPLPESTYLVPKLGKMSVNAYTADQMLAYGNACAEAAQQKTLTDEEIEAVFDSIDSGKDAPWWYRYARAIEAAVRGTEMTDIVQRLRRYTRDYGSTLHHDALIQEAADEIEQLRAAAARYVWLRGAAELYPGHPIWNDIRDGDMTAVEFDAAVDAEMGDAHRR